MDFNSKFAHFFIGTLRINFKQERYFDDNTVIGTTAACY